MGRECVRHGWRVRWEWSEYVVLEHSVFWCREEATHLFVGVVGGKVYVLVCEGCMCGRSEPHSAREGEWIRTECWSNRP